MKNVRNWFSIASAVALAIILFTSVAVTTAHAQTYTVLYNFGGVSGDPQYPLDGPIAQGEDGNLYATSFVGGSKGRGTVFKITLTGALTVLSNLEGTSGRSPYGGVTLGSDGNFYGTTAFGGTGRAGTVFQITPEGKLGVLYSFSGHMDNGQPHAPPIQGADGNLYGTTRGYADPTLGTVYKIATPQHVTTMHQFTGGADGEYPEAPLLQATDGNFYGTTHTSNAFKISPAGAFTSLGLFPGSSNSPLIQASNGHFYGVAVYGGTYSNGTLFEMSRGGKTRVLHNFNNLKGDGSYPYAGLVQATDGNFYGATSSGGVLGWGTIYRLSTTGQFTVVYIFDGSTGSYPETTLVQHTNGILYGETYLGGTYGGGVFYSLDIGAAPFVRLVTTFGKAGKTIGILGQGFTGTTEVSFNGIPATFTVSSDTYLEATVPAGATTGFVTVTTSTGTLTSNQQIQIRQ